MLRLGPDQPEQREVVLEKLVSGVLLFLPLLGLLPSTLVFYAYLICVVGRIFLLRSILLLLASLLEVLPTVVVLLRLGGRYFDNNGSHQFTQG